MTHKKQSTFPTVQSHSARGTRWALLALSGLLSVQSQAAPQSIARQWDERALAAIRVDTPHPPAQARNLFSLSVCMYDAWAAYDPSAVGFVYHNKHTAGDLAAARREAISYAAYRMLIERHAYSRTATNTLPLDHEFMASLGYDTNNISRDVSTPAGLGNTIYDAVSAWFINDGSRQTNGIPYPTANPPTAYPGAPASAGGYVFANLPLATAYSGITDGTNASPNIADVNLWQRLIVANSIDQNGFPQNPLQGYLGQQWLTVRPYQLARIDPTIPWIDPGPPPHFGSASHAQFVKEVVAVIRASSYLTPDDGETIDISPGANGNNSLDFEGDYGTNSFKIYDGHGYAENPITHTPYTPNVVKRGDYARALSEFWADGPSSETPPGHWNVVANDTSDSPLLVKKIGGVGPVVDDLEWDVKLYFALNASLHEAACSCWAVKRYYNGWRPLSAVRYLGMLGQSSDPGVAPYNPQGLPIIPGLIEPVTEASVASGKHAGLTVGKLALYGWPGQPADPKSDYQGVVWEHADQWITYQKKTFVTPAFPGYISGHSTFSRSAAEVLTSFTGSPIVPGGLASYTIKAETGLVNEFGPSEAVQLQWTTFYDAADQAGLSRVFGGIHPPIDNLWGRRVGSETGKQVWNAARKYFDGSVTNAPISLALRKLDSGHGEVRYNTIRAMYYQLQSANDVAGPYSDLPDGRIRAVDSSIAFTNNLAGSGTFFRAKQSLNP